MGPSMRIDRAKSHRLPTGKAAGSVALTQALLQVVIQCSSAKREGASAGLEPL